MVIYITRDNDIEYFIECQCHSEGLNITDYAEDDVIYLSMWYYGHHNLSWSNKLRWIWNIIKGKPYPDELVIDKGKIPEIIRVLEKIINRKK